MAAEFRDELVAAANERPAPYRAYVRRGAYKRINGGGRTGSGARTIWPASGGELAASSGRRRARESTVEESPRKVEGGHRSTRQLGSGRARGRFAYEAMKGE